MTMLWGAIRHYMNTGKAPQTTKDYFFPQKADGTRESPLTYVTDAYEFAKSPLHTLGNKASPLINLLSAIVSNKDYQGNRLWDPEETVGEKAADAAKYAGKELLPISVRQWMQGSQQDTPIRDRILPAIGIRNAPRDIDQSDAERVASEITQAQMPAEGRSKLQAQRRDAEHQISQLVRAGKPPGPAIAKAMQAGTLTSQEIRETLSTAHLSPLAAQVHRMGLEPALRVWQAASREERRTLRPILAKKMSGMAALPPAERNALMPQLQRALRGE
jgi:hypothetical protein